MIKHFYFLLSVILLLFTDSFSQSIEKYFYKRLEGFLGSQNITMNLTKEDSVAVGNYFGTDSDMPVSFSYNSFIDNYGNVYLEESESDENSLSSPMGSFNGSFSTGSTLEGIWYNQDSTVSYPFFVKESYPPGSVKILLKHFGDEYRLSNDSGFAQIDFIYPQLIELEDTVVRSIINSRFLNSFLKDYLYAENDTSFNSLEEIKSFFINRFKNEVENNYQLYSGRIVDWQNAFITEITYNSNYILSSKSISFSYEGGAHPITFIKRESINLLTGKEIVLSDIFKPGFETLLNKRAENIFKITYGFDPETDLDSLGFTFENGKFKLNENFSISESGLIFQFNQYEIAPYSFGAPTVFIFFDDILDLLKDNSIISNTIFK